jgi:hypothetical protein
MTSRATTTNVANVVGPVHFHQWRIRAPQSPKNVWTVESARVKTDRKKINAINDPLTTKTNMQKSHAAHQRLQNFDNHRWCRAREKVFVADEDLAEDDIKNSKRIFNMIDTCGDGSVTYDEMMDSFRFCGFDPDPVAIQEIVDKGDMNRTGTICFPEFLSMTSSKENKAHFESLGRRGVPPIDAWVLAYNRRTALCNNLGNEALSVAVSKKSSMWKTTTGHDGRKVSVLKPNSMITSPTPKHNAAAVAAAKIKAAMVAKGRGNAKYDHRLMRVGAAGVAHVNAKTNSRNIFRDYKNDLQGHAREDHRRQPRKKDKNATPIRPIAIPVRDNDLWLEHMRERGGRFRWDAQREV